MTLIKFACRGPALCPLRAKKYGVATRLVQFFRPILGGMSEIRTLAVYGFINIPLKTTLNHRNIGPEEAE